MFSAEPSCENFQTSESGGISLENKVFSENHHLVACLGYCSATANLTLIREAGWQSCCSGMLLCMTPCSYLNLRVYLSVCLEKMSLYYDELSFSGEHTWSPKEEAAATSVHGFIQTVKQFTCLHTFPQLYISSPFCLPFHFLWF